MPMPTVHPIRQLQIIDQILAGSDLAQVSQAQSINLRRINDLAKSWGHPDPARLRSARAAILDQANADRARNGLDPIDADKPMKPDTATDGDTRKPRPVADLTAAELYDRLRQTAAYAELVRRGEKSTRQRSRTLVARATQALRDLATQLVKEADIDAARNGIPTGDPAERLARVRKAAAAKLTVDLIRAYAGPAAIRTWAQNNGHEVPARGVIADKVVLAYADAHPDVQKAIAA